MSLPYTRPAVQLLALVMFFLVPLLDLFRMDLVHLHFYLFREKFAFSEGYILLLVILTIVFTFVTLSQFAHRMFCGFVCPHGTFSNLLIRLNQSPNMRNPFIRHTVDLLVSLIAAPLIAFCLLSYFMAPVELWGLITTGSLANIQGFFFIGSCLVFFFMTYRFRLRFCQQACPYGVLQNAFSSGTSSKRLFTPVRIGLLVVMVSLISVTTMLALNRSGFYADVAKKLDGIPSHGKYIFSYELTIENMKKIPNEFSITYNGIPGHWQTKLPEQINVPGDSSATRPLLFYTDAADIGHNYMIEMAIANQQNRTVVRRVTIFPVPRGTNLSQSSYNAKKPLP
ncbi:4Fe-4S binding protein [Brevibacillus dissolubilis]|uniref:4Fe-4S binding protein n=1 Tax=Brevibacillus dissolubilis TaxID=1844116 RepID=UPI00159BD8CC|nr:4Fe-4S binding protein [Brevibacillus dissolubilis]